mgnify:CR=1 FL=1
MPCARSPLPLRTGSARGHQCGRASYDMGVGEENSKLFGLNLLWFGMDQNKTALERAFELARSGRYPTVELIRRAVSAEGYFQNQLEGRELSRQLRSIIAAATATTARD